MSPIDFKSALTTQNVDRSRFIEVDWEIRSDENTPYKPAEIGGEVYVYPKDSFDKVLIATVIAYGPDRYMKVYETFLWIETLQKYYDFLVEQYATDKLGPCQEQLSIWGLEIHLGEFVYEETGLPVGILIENNCVQLLEIQHVIDEPTSDLQIRTFGHLSWEHPSLK